jgi:hypothetical protein
MMLASEVQNESALAVTMLNATGRRLDGKAAITAAGLWYLCQ